MRVRLACLISLLILSLGTLATLSLTWGQDQPAPVVAPPASPPPLQPPAVARPAQPAQPKVDVKNLPPLAQQMYMSAYRGADWLFRANRPDGRFDYGYLPALKTRLEGDHYLRQAGAAFALARAARFTADERHTAVARQAVLSLLLDTTTDDKKQVRCTTLPSVMINRLGAAGLLVLAINELPSPADELLDQSEQLCRYIRQQQQPDGSLCYTDTPGDAKAAEADPEGVNTYPGAALYALMRSQRYRPADWKVEVVRKALAYYRAVWQKNKDMAFVPWQTAAFAEAFLVAGDKAFAEFVFDMNDAFGSYQYGNLDPRHPMWLGGFMGSASGRPVIAEPNIGSAAYANALAEACRAARKAGDAARHDRYRSALESCLQFVTTLQYTDANTQHFAEWYRPRLLGGFYASHQDGNLRIDYTEHAVCALVQYVEQAGGAH